MKGLIIINFKGVSLNRLKRYQEALKMFDEAIKLNPNYFDAFLNKG